MTEFFGEALARLFLPVNLAAMFLGTGGGIFIGAQPDLSPSICMALLLPVVISLPPETGLIVLAAVYFGSVFGGSVSAIICRIPGVQASGITVLDGYQMAVKGRAVQAVAVACMASTVGGLLSIIAVWFSVEKIAMAETYFRGADEFWLLIMAIVSVASISSRSAIRGFMAGIAGAALAAIGQDPLTEMPRLPFLADVFPSGFPLSVIVIGVFGLAPVLSMGEQKFHRRAKPYPLVGKKCPPRGELANLSITVIYAWISGFLVGILPGTGASVGARLAYRNARDRSADKHMFGRGSAEGVAAAEAGNNAATGGALIPTLAFGIPGDAATAVLLAGVHLMRLPLGHRLFNEHGQLAYTFLLGGAAVHFCMLLLGLTAYRFFALGIKIPERVIIPLLTVAAVIGCYMVNERFADVMLLPAFALVGFFMRKFSLKPAAFLTGFLLGPAAEVAWRNTVVPPHVSTAWSVLTRTSMSRVFILVSLSFLIVPVFFDHFRDKMSSKVGAFSNQNK
ncbi:tripartite tricarboxylate transporter permease [Mageeibacillus indolicus]|uniref:Membrane protein n=2 Tax=Mageeibacillus indolicus TaxID=884684 RepID=D3R350_MAGIU|nr:tripartite tricarboxylate transporter permease [Mageeibacillus indolicus]ADC91792.1 membrane protein [Mageeibacillus indolicus UPII9-5]KFA56840.1 hypothetical protein HMPREF1632_06810 [Mageeibacillus indolicus 0009-5]PNH18092.1 hypothetical protein B7R76_07100 [Mageeibacillus indolicus]